MSPVRQRTGATTSQARPGKGPADLQGRGVLITGAATGIGQGLALAFAEAGARVTILDCDAKKGRTTLAELRRIDRHARFIHADLRRDADIRRAATAVFGGKQPADILINNAACMGRTQPFLDVSRADYEAILRSNVSGPFLLSQLAARAMVAAGRKGTIINVHAIQTSLPLPGYSAYVTSKGAVDAMTLALAVDLAPHGIRVNGVEVGCVATESAQHDLRAKLNTKGSPGSAAALDRLIDQRAATLLGRMGRPDEIARVVMFLASDESSFLTGSIIRADGGRSISRKPDPLLNLDREE